MRVFWGRWLALARASATAAAYRCSARSQTDAKMPETLPRCAAVTQTCEQDYTKECPTYQIGLDLPPMTKLFKWL